MAWMEHGLQISLKRSALLIEDKMVALVFGCATNHGSDGRFIFTINACTVHIVLFT